MTASESAAAERHDSLPLGSLLQEFEIRSVLGFGGFSIVYVAYDQTLDRDVALKEYMPAAFAARTQGVTVSVSSPRNAEAFAVGLRSFLNEARLLARFDHPALVKVHRFWEANGTAYMVMPLYRGRTLKALVATDGPQPEPWLRALLAQMMDALDVLHAAGCYHRDIAPDNILILEDERALLLDFGAARRVIGDATQDITVILKPGYAPIEQYGFGDESRQGAWTDIYALGAVVRFCATGRTPQPAGSRVNADRMEPLAVSAAVPLTGALCSAADRALAIKAKDRPQSIAELRAALAEPDAKANGSVDDTTVLWAERLVGAGAPINRHALPPARATSAATQPPAKSRRALRATGISVAIAIVASWALWFYLGGPGSDSRDGESSRTAQAGDDSASGRTPVPNTGSPASVTEQAFPQAATGAAVPPAPELPPPAKIPADNPAGILRDLAATGAAGWKVSVALPSQSLRIGRDLLAFSVSSSRAGYVYVLMADSEGRGLRLLFPNQFDTANRIQPETPLALPRKNWQMRAAGPAGTNEFVVLITPSARDFSDIGTIRRNPFMEFDPKAAIAARARHGAAAFAGTPTDCRLTADQCTVQGVASFTLAEVAN